MKIRVVTSQGEHFDLQGSNTLRLLHILQDAEIPVNAACGGQGSCTKCRVRIVSGFASVSAADRRAFQEGELKKGWRLSCQCLPRTQLEVLVPEIESLKKKARFLENEILSSANLENCQFVCDLGSTGLVLALVGNEGNILAESHILNGQVRYGSDVMTRLKVAQEGNSHLLREALGQSLSELFLPFLTQLGEEKINELLKKKVFFAGNSAMTSLLQMWPTESLAVSPFQPARKDICESQFTIKSLKKEVAFINLPLLGGFVGGDTFAGFLEIEKLSPKAPWMLVDIGTNTEIVLCAQEGGPLYFASAPAGPAFEGGNITFGMRAENGAIASVHYDIKSKNFQVEVIGKDKARGLCGSGLIDALSESLEHGFITEDGFVPNGSVSIAGEVQIFAEDVREFQLAKSATRTGCEILLKRAGLEKVEELYLAGTFAEHLNLESTKKLGLLPEANRLIKIGNASLKGLLKWKTMSEAQRKDFSLKLDARLIAVELALQDDFQPAFIKHLNFTKERNS